MTVHEVGKGRPVVYLHGLLGLNEHWIPTARTLAHRARSIMLETPLLTLSGRLCSIQGVSQMLGALIEELVDEPAVIVGSSFGGHVALRIVLDRPSIASGLILVGSSGLYEADYEDEIEARMRMKDVEIRPSKEWMNRKVAELFHDPSTIPDGVVERVHAELSHRRAARAIVKLSRTSRRDHVGKQLDAVSIPSLVLWGRQDIVTPPRVARDFESLLPDARLHWIDDCGHAPMIEKPREFTEAIGAFLDELDSRASRSVGSRQEVA
ncbi:MAG: alpha/beta hydrolase [Planctomycetota bacterium]|nr:alpha/beta hydrolase [Planctomycetota bacterium]